MKVLEYTELDTARVRAAYEKVRSAIERDDFRSADVKKLAPGRYYRARLGHADRLLFAIVRYGGEAYALMLEVIEGHAYDRSRFLRGAVIDESKVEPVEAAAAGEQAEPVRYLHPARREFHLLDRPISFDDAQEAVYRTPAPLIIVGSAGSGKTALTLEKMKHAEGDVLYVTHSAYLAQSARSLYYAHGFERDAQNASFLSYREFLETIRVPDGRELAFRDFRGWFERQRQAFKGVDAHQAFEEIKGVITADTTGGGPLGRDAYRALGVRQSIFADAQRDRIYDLFERYRAWLGQAGLVDLNLCAHDHLALAQPSYDFVVIDEAQDLTNVQLALVLRTLRRPGNFLLCGDSNQIVHPNFFSWSRVKSLFWRDPALAERQKLSVLHANFRNAREVTRVANTLLRIKHARFGSIDRESNFLVDAVSPEPGVVELLPDKDVVKRDLDRQTRQSTRFAVLTMRDEDKADARQSFRTPLVFSIQEAKGLEYENIVLYNFVSGSRAAFHEIVQGVAADDLDAGSLDYRRARDKLDKSLEVYKFYVNALYVALTRATRNVYLIESDTRHALLRLLGLRLGAETVSVEAAASSIEDWQKEARNLELQGKQEQADEIRRTILQAQPVPWPVFDEARVRDLLAKVLQEKAVGGKLRQQLHEYAVCYDEPALAGMLAGNAPPGPWSKVQPDAARRFAVQRQALRHKHLAAYYARNLKDALRQCDQYGVDHRTPMNQTPLMAAAIAGNIALVEALLDRGADPELTDHFGRNALHWALLESFSDARYAAQCLPALWERIAPPAIDVMVGGGTQASGGKAGSGQAGDGAEAGGGIGTRRGHGRLIRIDRHLGEYFLFQAMFALCKSLYTALGSGPLGFDTATLLAALEPIPTAVVKPERKRRQYLSHVLSRNETARDYAYNRHLFRRLRQGWYQFDPLLRMRCGAREGGAWRPIYEVLNLALIVETAPEYRRGFLCGLISLAKGADESGSGEQSIRDVE